MRPITIHPLSLALGGLLAIAAILALGAAPVPPGQGFRIEYGPLPKDMMSVREGQPFTVPPGKVYVCAGLGTNGFGTSTTVTLTIDGVSLLQAIPTIGAAGGPDGGGGPSIASVPPGLTASAGSVVEVVSSVGEGLALGYLAND